MNQTLHPDAQELAIALGALLVAALPFVAICAARVLRRIAGAVRGTEGGAP